MVAPDVFTIDDPCIEGFISWEAGCHKSCCFLAFNKVKTNGINRKVGQFCVNIANIAKVGLDEDLQAFFICQECLIDV